MYSTLYNQPNLTSIYSFKNMILSLLLSWISPRSKFYLIVRNPFERTVSFYKDKFRNAERVRLWMKKNNLGKWQKCTEYFFPYLDLNMQSDPKVVSRKLETTSFEKVILVLPKVYMKDGHMKPQYHSRKIKFSKFGINFSLPIRYEKNFKIESEDDLQELSKIFDLNLNIKVNTSKNVDEKIIWRPNLIEIVESLYEKDFKYFGYEKKTKN